MKKVSTTTLILAGGILLGGLALLALPFIQERIDRSSFRTHAMNRAIAAMVRNEKSAALSALYEQRAWQPLWVTSDGALSRDGRKVQMLFAAAADHGLPAQRYRMPPPEPEASPQALARYDIAFSQAATAYARDMAQGALNPRSLFPDAEGHAPDKELPGKLAAAAHNGRAAEFLADLEPGGDYQRLKAALQMYRAGPEWVTVTAASRAALPARLAAEGYLVEPNLSPRDVDAALKAWQAANGIEPDGKLGPQTIAALNIDRRMRAAQIAANMERWRWLPRQLPARYIWVDIPSAHLALMENGRAALTSRVVVGAPDNATPLFVDEAVAVTLNPKWNVPKSITENELLPKLQEDPNYLADRNIIEVDGRLVQQPGPQNALGMVKFELPNHFDVYLHDTPAKNAFLSDERALSHGCVRVQAIHDLAALALGIPRQELEAEIAKGETQRKPLPQPIPVFFQYATAVPLPDGKTGFRDDVYQRDAKMIAEMQKLSSQGSIAQVPSQKL